MPNGKRIGITVIDEDGNEKKKVVNDGVKLSSVVPKDKVAILNGIQQERDRELRAGDRVHIVRRSYKNG